MKEPIHFTKNFMKCGLMGWGLECFWTGCHQLINRKDGKLMCQTSIWMFPIYGMAAFIEPVYHVIKKKNPVFRGSIYTIFIYLAELSTGIFLKKKNCCPWDYSDAKHNYKGIIRLDYIPVWFFVGLLYEKVLIREKN